MRRRKFHVSNVLRWHRNAHGGSAGALGVSRTVKKGRPLFTAEMALISHCRADPAGASAEEHGRRRERRGGRRGMMTGYPTAGQIEAARARLAAAPAGLFVDGGWRPALSGETFETIDPATGGTLATVAGAGPADIDAAVAAARRALSSGAWPAATPPERARMLLRLARLIEAAADEIALVEVLDQGKPYRAARNGDMRGAIAALEYFAGWATKIAGTTLPSSLPGEWHVFTARQPVGVVGQIIPWNFPFAMAVNKIAPALAAGCTVVLKPAEQTPLSALLLARLVAEADFPPGVVNIVTGLGAIAGHALAAHGDVDKLAFTGSTATGRAIVTAALGNMKRVALELGRKSPVIVFEDADVEARDRGRRARHLRQCRPGLRRRQPPLRPPHIVRSRGGGHRPPRAGAPARRRARSAGRHGPARLRRAARPRARPDRGRPPPGRRGRHRRHRPRPPGLFRRAHRARERRSGDVGDARGDLRAGALRHALRRLGRRYPPPPRPTTPATACRRASGPATCRARTGWRAG